MLYEPTHIILPGTGAELLRQEIGEAFAGLGLKVFHVEPRCIEEPEQPGGIAQLLDGSPALLLSINFQGLSKLKESLAFLEKRGARAAVWCVDNPWNLLSGVRDPRWKALPFFVTDPSFVPPLHTHGATGATHLPLACSPERFSPNQPRSAHAVGPLQEPLAPFVFVGRSAFPGKEAFFSGISVPGELMANALPMLENGERPDLLWWERRLAEYDASQAPCATPCAPGDTPRGAPGEKAHHTAPSGTASARARMAARAAAMNASLAANVSGTSPSTATITTASPCAGSLYWPGKKARRPALGAEESNRHWRALCLCAAAAAPCSREAFALDVFGDSGWQGLLPASARLMPPVDYYTQLPAIYAAARHTIALTSLQLPHGLNQRHFDVWAAGGLCLSDATPGLSLFPEELTRPITFAAPGDKMRGLLAVAENIDAGEGGGRAALIRDWQAHLFSHHTYTHRAIRILEHVAACPAPQHSG